MFTVPCKNCIEIFDYVRRASHGFGFETLDICFFQDHITHGRLPIMSIPQPHIINEKYFCIVGLKMKRVALNTFYGKEG